MDGLGIAERVYLSTWMQDYVHKGAQGLFLVLAVITVGITLLERLKAGSIADRSYDRILRLLFVGVCLGAYRHIVDALLTAGDWLSLFLATHASYDSYWQTVQHNIAVFLKSGESSVWDRFVNLAKGTLLTTVVSLSYFALVLVFEFVRTLSTLVASILYVLGPLVMVGGMVGRGISLVQWFSSFVQVLLWPSVPMFALLMVTTAPSNSNLLGNIPSVLLQNVVLIVVSLFAPLVVMFIVRYGGIASIMSSVMLSAIETASKAVNAATSMIAAAIQRRRARDRMR